MILARRIGAAVLALAAIAAWFFMAPVEPKVPVVKAQQPVTDQSGAISQALSDYDENNRFTTGAPQQQVVNGWAAKDLLTVIARQQNEALTRSAVAVPLPPATPNDNRIPALIALLVLGMALILITSREPGDTPIRAAGPSPDASSGPAH